MNITFNARCIDPDLDFGQMLTIIWSSNVSGELRRFTSEDAASFKLSTLAPGTHLVTVTASDGEFKRSASVTVTVRAEEVVLPDGGGGGVPTGVVLAGVLVAVAVVAAGVVWRKRRAAGPKG